MSERQRAKGADDALRLGRDMRIDAEQLEQIRNGAAAPDPFARGIITADQLPDPEDPPRLWFGLYQASVTMLIGETGAGKSSILYNTSIHAARNETLWSVSFALPRPLRVLYVDPENAGNWEEHRGGVCALRVERIGQGKPAGLRFHDGAGVNLSDPTHVHALEEYLIRESIDLCILDPIAVLFDTQDENDNAEAARQMRSLTYLSRRTGACVVPCHHTGKDSSGNYGRGASARLAAADVGIVFRTRTQDEEQDDDYQGETRERDDLCRLQIVKNRWEGRGSLYLRMAGSDRFERVGFEEWRAGAGHAARPSKAERCAEEIRLFLMDGVQRAREEIVSAMKAEGFGRQAVDEALAVLAEEPGIEKEVGAHNAARYRLAPADQESEQESEIEFSSFPAPLGGLENWKTEIQTGGPDDEPDDGPPAMLRGY